MVVEKSEESKLYVKYESNFLELKMQDESLLKLATRVKSGKISIPKAKGILQKKVRVRCKDPIDGTLWQESFDEIYTKIDSDYDIEGHVQQQTLMDHVQQDDDGNVINNDSSDEDKEIIEDAPLGNVDDIEQNKENDSMF